MLHTIHLQMVLVPNESKIVPKSHDEILDVLDDLLFHLALVHINGLALANLLHIDEIQQIFIFEHHHGLTGQSGIRQSLGEIAGD